MDNKKRLEKYNAMEDGKTKQFYESPKTTEHVLDVCIRHDLSEKQIAQTALFVEDIILGLANPSDLLGNLRAIGINENKSARIASELISFLSKGMKSETETGNRNDSDIIYTLESETPIAESSFSLKKERLNRPVEPVSTNKRVEDSAEETTSTSPDPSAITPLRTMDTDMSKVHGYNTFRQIVPLESDDDEPVHKSSQDDVFTKPKLAPTPTYNEKSKSSEK